jgi:hypothetical protein
VQHKDIVIYSDCNIKRYKERIMDCVTIKDTAKKLFDHIDCDFLISKDHNKLKIKHHVKESALKYIIGKRIWWYV